MAVVDFIKQAGICPAKILTQVRLITDHKNRCPQAGRLQSCGDAAKAGACDNQINLRDDRQIPCRQSAAELFLVHHTLTSSAFIGLIKIQCTIIRLRKGRLILHSGYSCKR